MQHSDNAPYTFGLSPLTCSTAVFGHETHCSCTKLHVTAVCYRDSRNDSNCRFCPINGIQQKAIACPAAIKNRTSRVSSTNGSTAVASVCVCVCMCVRACVRAERQYWCDWFRFYIYHAVYKKIRVLCFRVKEIR